MSDLRHDIKRVIIEALNLEEEYRIEDITNDQPLFGDGGLGLDSVDALELAVEFERVFGVTLPDDARSREIFTSVDSLAQFIGSSKEAS